MKRSIQEIEADLRKAIAEKRAEGFTVLPGSWGLAEIGDRWIPDPLSGNCLCPMACTIVEKDRTSFAIDEEEAAAAQLGCTPRDISNFVVGFDAAEMDVGGAGGYDPGSEFYLLGKEFRAEFFIEDAE